MHRCTTDAECAAGWTCQKDAGTCTRKPYVAAKAIGESCTSADACWCIRRTLTKGYCTQFCRVGSVGTCPGGFACDPGLPTEFTTAPADLAGHCAKTCTSDADCVNSSCVAAGGLALKV